MKRFLCLLTGLLLFSCNNAPMVSPKVEAEEEWIYGSYRSSSYKYYMEENGVLDYQVISYGGDAFGNYIENIERALVYRKKKNNYLEIVGHPIPPLAFSGNHIEYQDSLFTIYAEKNDDRIYIEFTAPWGYTSDYAKRKKYYLNATKTKTFLSRLD